MSLAKAPTPDAWARISQPSHGAGRSLLEQLRAVLAGQVFPLVLRHVAGYAGAAGAARRRTYALSMLQDDAHLFRMIRKVEGDIRAAALSLARSLAWKLLVRLAGHSHRGVWTIMPLDRHSSTLVSGSLPTSPGEQDLATNSSSPLFWMNDETTDAADRPVVVASIRTLSIAPPSTTNQISAFPEHHPVNIEREDFSFDELGEATTPDDETSTTGDMVSDSDVLEDVEAFLHKEGDEIGGVNAYLLAGLEIARLAIDDAYRTSVAQGVSTPVLQATLVIDLRPNPGGNSLSIAKAGMELLPELERLSKRHFVSLWSGVHVVGFGWIHAGLWAFAKKILPPSAAERVRFPSSSEDVRKIWCDTALSDKRAFPRGVGADDDKSDDTLTGDSHRPSVHASTNTGLQKWSCWVPGFDVTSIEPVTEKAQSALFDDKGDDLESVYDDFKSMAGTATSGSRFLTPLASRVVSPTASKFVTPSPSRPSSPVHAKHADKTIPYAANKLRQLQQARELHVNGLHHNDPVRPHATGRGDQVPRYDAANPYFGYPAVMRGGVGLRASNCSPARANGPGRVEAASRRKRHLARTLAYLFVLRIVSFPVQLWAAVISRLPRAVAVALGGLDEDAGTHEPPHDDIRIPASRPPNYFRTVSKFFMHALMRTLALTLRILLYPLRLLVPQLARPHPYHSAVTASQKSRIDNGGLLRIGGAKKDD